MKKVFVFCFLILLLLILPSQASAHEVYVLNSAQIDKDLQVQSLHIFASLYSPGNWLWLVVFAAAAIVSLSISFVISFSGWGVAVAKGIKKMSPLALPVIRVVFGIALISSASHMSLFGPELPLSHLPGSAVLNIALFVAGVLLIAGLFVRITAIVLFCIFFLAVGSFHWYMLTYINYLGEILVLLLFGGDIFCLDRLVFAKVRLFSLKQVDEYAFAMLRISFALSLLYAAVYVKFLHPALSYQVVVQYHLTRFFHFDPLFVVLGAGCIEVVIALLFLVGLNMRWNILFFAFWATLSLLFFGEAVWPHYILFGISIGLFLYGYDRFTLEKWLVRKTKKLLFQ